MYQTNPKPNSVPRNNSPKLSINEWDRPESQSVKQSIAQPNNLLDKPM
jgi:hypothetical protein